MMKGHVRMCLAIVLFSVLMAACVTAPSTDKKETFGTEPQWIRNGEPITFENEIWDPQDDVENLLDDEVQKIATYRGLPVYIDKRDVRPYNRLYTRFGPHKFRYFLKRSEL